MSLATASCARGSRCRALPGCRRGIRNTRSVCPGAATRRWSSSVQRERPRFREETLKRIATLVAGVDEQFVKDHSPLSPERRTPAWFLMQLYRPGESVLVFDDFKSQGRHVRHLDDQQGGAACLDHLVNGCRGGIWCWSPMSRSRWTGWRRWCKCHCGSRLSTPPADRASTRSCDWTRPARRTGMPGRADSSRC